MPSRSGSERSSIRTSIARVTAHPLLCRVQRGQLDEFNAVATGEVPGAQGIEYRIVIDLQETGSRKLPLFPLAETMGNAKA
jgi:hypothetical protein